MISSIFFLIALALVSGAFSIGRKWNVGYFLCGLTFGILNEFCFESCWSYSDHLKPLIWRNVPLIVVLGWSICTALALSISDRIFARYAFSSRWVRRSFDVLFFFAIGYSIEVLMICFGFWQFNIAHQGIAGMQLFGYVFVGLLVSWAGRSFQALVDNRGRLSYEPI